MTKEKAIDWHKEQENRCIERMHSYLAEDHLNLAAGQLQSAILYREQLRACEAIDDSAEVAELKRELQIKIEQMERWRDMHNALQSRLEAIEAELLGVASSIKADGYGFQATRVMDIVKAHFQPPSEESEPKEWLMWDGAQFFSDMHGSLTYSKEWTEGYLWGLGYVWDAASQAFQSPGKRIRLVKRP